MDEIIKYYDELAFKYDTNRFNNTYGDYIDYQERLILSRLLINPNEVVLDLACGTGRLSKYANYGIDASPNMIEVARSKFPNKNFLVGVADKISLEDSSVDTIICFHFFMHLNQSKFDLVLKECHRILKPNGRIIFDIPSKKRRRLISYKANNWHAAFSLSFDDLKMNSTFKIKRTFGYLIFPIHRFPKFLRKASIGLDSIISNSIFKEYSSYLVIEFLKKG